MWLSVDPVTHHSQSPYNAFDGNPVFWADPSGADSVTITIDWNQLGTNSTTDIFNNGSGNWSSFSTDFEDIELLPELTLTANKGGFFSSNAGGIIQGHVYWNGKNYQGWRDKQASKQWDDLQEMFDYVGTVPALGEPVDLINAGISAIRGNYAQAGLGLAAMVPFAGWAATAIKIQKHHIIPRAVYNNASAALQKAIDLNGGFNLKNLPFPFHGNHPQYSKYVTNQLNNLKTITPGSIKELQKDLSGMINTAYDNYKVTGDNLNDYFRILNGN